MKPILFNTEMVRAILDGRKTQTRRVIKPQPAGDGSAPEPLETRPGAWNAWGDDNVLWPAYQPGDVLWVRETWAKLYYVDPQGYTHFDQPMYFYAADGAPDITLRDADGFEEPDQRIKWHPSIHMPREAARIFLRVTDVRVERLWDIQPADICAEGVPIGANDSADMAYESFSALWDSTIKPADRDRFGWEANPWAWVYTFERIEKGEHGIMCKFCEVYNFKHVGIDFGIDRGDRPGIYLCGGLGEAPPEERFRFCPWCGEKLRTEPELEKLTQKQYKEGRRFDP